ncbi:DUF971 domain-containing protein [Verrucomicrobiaceae bacterium 227]
MSVIKLQNATVIGDELALAWEGGGETYIRLEALRRGCPCAACQGEPDVTGMVVVPHVTYNDRSFQYQRHQLMGGYALQFFWADGHSSGIYSFALLQRMGEAG